MLVGYRSSSVRLELVDTARFGDPWHPEFYIAKFLSGLNPSLSHARAQLMAEDSIPILSNAMSHVLCY